MLSTNDYEDIVLRRLSLIDVRAPIEFEKGAFPNAVNLPILNDEQRHIIGIRYKEKGNDEATKLGYELVSGTIKEEKVKAWLNELKKRPQSLIYCFRGGSRSKISQEWIAEAGKDVVRIEGGFKALRNYLLDNLDPQNLLCKPILLGGMTGAGKTKILRPFPFSIDLEGIANHRGSTFGRHITPQPSQINFEHELAYALIRHKHHQFPYLLLEDEGKNVGKNMLPKPLYYFFNSGGLILTEVPLEERAENTLQEYVIDAQQEYINVYGEKGLSEWQNYILESLSRIQSKLGQERYEELLRIFDSAFKFQLNTGRLTAHKDWIALLLKEYYDPMYAYSIRNTTRKIIFKGNVQEVTQFLTELK